MAQKRHQKNLDHNHTNLLKGGPQVPEEHALCQEAQQEGPEEDAANNAKAMNARAEASKALVKPKEVKPKIPKGNSCKLS
ncbi:60S ribosomal protein L29 [Camelus dromedarius]|uniref:60S ribosomal protein L29 n=1 Tax=Camelus dromedarius TaxID=9838 RepID=A0A5N4DX03_CAMDR|nr:60S ribosomal protein L29 [Camelus dromedarius]